MKPPLLLFFFLLSCAAEVRVQIIYDNTVAQPGLEAQWGFAAVVDAAGHRVLFDSGTKPAILAGNLARLKIDPASFEQVLISHAHDDHAAGLAGIKAAGTLNLLDRFPQPLFDRASAAGWKIRRVQGPLELSAGVWTTGVVEGNPVEQALVIETPKGLVVLTGCSHPGIVRIVETATRQRSAKRVRMLIGGFHLLNEPVAALQEIARRLKGLGVEAIVPSHCTGEAAIALFKTEWGPRFEPGGAGKLIRLD